jgi:hypothetical protein
MGRATEEAFFENWSVRRNWFTDITKPRDQAFIQQDPSNRSGPLKFLSTDEDHRDFLRLLATSPGARRRRADRSRYPPTRVRAARWRLVYASSRAMDGSAGKVAIIIFLDGSVERVEIIAW